MMAELPPSIAQRAKQPYRSPDAAAFVQWGTPDYVKQLLGRDCLTQYGYFDADKVGRLVAKLQRSRVNAARDNMAFVGILSTQLWHSHFVEERWVA
jgi:asparagine synthase (glutamine-hydrolysing)